MSIDRTKTIILDGEWEITEFLEGDYGVTQPVAGDLICAQIETMEMAEFIASAPQLKKENEKLIAESKRLREALEKIDYFDKANKSVSPFQYSKLMEKIRKEISVVLNHTEDQS